MGVAPLRATSCLAENSWPILESLVSKLSPVAGEIEIVPGLDPADADLLFACGLLTQELIAAGAPLEIVAAPIFAGESQAVYRSVVITHSDRDLDLERGHYLSFAVNDYASWSGWFGYLALLRAHGHSAPPDRRRLETGSHLRSIEAVAGGAADVAAIDSSVWHHYRDRSDDLEVIAITPDWPAPPVSVGPRVDRTALAVLFAGPDIVAASGADYDEMLTVRRSFN